MKNSYLYYMEQWKKIDDFNYEVSSKGNVRNFKTKKSLKQQSNANNQITVLLSDNGTDKRILVSRLVANAFLENKEGYNVVMHKDDDPTNNNLENLQWGTQKMNMHDMISKGRSKRILSDEDVKNIKMLHPKLSYREIAEMYNLSKSAIAFVIQERRYKNIKL